jgi:hypothetical protein
MTFIIHNEKCDLHAKLLPHFVWNVVSDAFDGVSHPFFLVLLDYDFLFAPPTIANFDVFQHIPRTSCVGAFETLRICLCMLACIN